MKIKCFVFLCGFFFSAQTLAEQASDILDEEIEIQSNFVPSNSQQKIKIVPTPTKESPDNSPLPKLWKKSSGRQCHRYLGRWVCEGPLKVPQPYGPDAELAQKLGLGTRKTAAILQTKAPLDEWVKAVKGKADKTLRWPVDDGNFWRGFGRRKHRGRWRFHKGIDIGAKRGTPMLSVRDGLVAYSDNRIRGYGNLMLIIHADATVAFYAHCHATYVFAGQQVKRGQIIGEVGSTGLSYGAHLHFELRKNGRAFNPMPLFENSPVRSKKRAKRAKRAKQAKRNQQAKRSNPSKAQ